MNVKLLYTLHNE